MTIDTTRADAAFRQTRAALDGDGGVSIARRAALAGDTVEMWPIESEEHTNG